MCSTKLHVVRPGGLSILLRGCLHCMHCCQDVGNDCDKLQDTVEDLIAANYAFGLHLIE